MVRRWSPNNGSPNLFLLNRFVQKSSSRFSGNPRDMMVLKHVCLDPGNWGEQRIGMRTSRDIFPPRVRPRDEFKVRFQNFVYNRGCVSRPVSVKNSGRSLKSSNN